MSVEDVDDRHSWWDVESESCGCQKMWSTDLAHALTAMCNNLDGSQPWDRHVF